MKMTHVVMAAVAAVVISSTVTAAIIYDDNFTTDPFAAPARFDAGSDPIAWKSTNNYMLYRGNGSMISTDPIEIDATQTNLFSYDFYFLATGTYTSAKMYGFTQDESDLGYYVTAYMASSGSDSRWLEDVRLTVDNTQTGWTQKMVYNTWYTMEMEILNNTSNDRSVVLAQVVDKTTSTVIGTFKGYENGAGRLTTHTGLVVAASGKDATKPTRVDNVYVTGTEIPEPATLSMLLIGGLGAMIRRR